MTDLTSPNPAFRSRRSFGTRVAPELLERLEDVRYRVSRAQRRRVTITALVEQALSEFLARSETGAL